MASYIYLKSANSRHIKCQTDVLDLIKKSKAEEKKEKRYTLILGVFAVSILVFTGFVISL
jgi:hypothetical protein